MGYTPKTAYLATDYAFSTRLCPSPYNRRGQGHHIMASSGTRYTSLRLGFEFESCLDDWQLPQLEMCHLDASENVLVAFEINNRERRPVVDVRQTKWATMTGRLLEKKTFQLPIQNGRPPLSRSYTGRGHWNTYGHKTVACLRVVRYTVPRVRLLCRPTQRPVGRSRYGE